MTFSRFEPTPRLWVAVSTSLALAACAAERPPCRTAGVCDQGSECLANRCVPMGSDPVLQKAERLVLRPSRLAASIPDDTPRRGTGASVYLGGPDTHRQQLYLDFDLRGAKGRLLDTALLVIYPVEHAEPLRQHLPVNVRPLANEWSMREVAAGFLPRATSETRRGIAHARSLVRIDVTELFEERMAPELFFGLVVAAEEARCGFVASTGLSGKAPELELYLRPEAR